METPKSQRVCCVVSSSTKPHNSTPTTSTKGARVTLSAKVTPSVPPKRRRASTLDTVHYTQGDDSNSKSTPRRSSAVLDSPVSRTPGRRLLKRSSLILSSTNGTPKRLSHTSPADDLGFGKTTILTSPTTATPATKATPRRIFRSSSRASETRKLTKEEEFKDWYDLLDKIKETGGGQEVSS